MIIGAGWESFVRVGQALTIIRKNRLYRQSFKTFEEYCIRKWQYAKSHAYRLIGAAETMRILSPNWGHSSPTSEAQVRPLIGLEPEAVKTVWHNAVKAAKGRRVTAKLVREAAKPFVPSIAEGQSLGSKGKRPTKALEPKHLIELRTLLKSADSWANETGQALRTRPLPGEILVMHERTRQMLQQALALLQSWEAEGEG